MTAPRVVPAFDEIEDYEPGLDLRVEPVPIEELALERGEEALAAIGDPQLVPADGCEVPLDEIRHRARRLIADGRAKRLAPAHALQAGAPQEPRDSLASDRNPPIRELGMDAGPAVGATRLAVDRLDQR